MPYIGNIVQDFSVNNAMLNTDSVTSIKIDDGTIVNADINASAAIAVSKLANFVTNNADNRLITGSGSANTLNGESSLTYGGTELLISNSSPSVKLNDTDNSGVVDINNVGGAAVFQSTGDTLFETNAAERMRINSSGNVGIGTTSPATLLHLKSSSADCALQIESTGSATDARLNLYGRSNGISQIRFGDEDDTNVGLLTYDHTGNYMMFRTADAERMRIDSSGHLLFAGTSEEITLQTSDGSDNGYLNLSGGGACNQNRGAQLVLSGNERSGLLGTCQLMAGNAGSASSVIQFFTGGSEQARVDASGKVGIGVSSPTAKLHIAENASGTTDMLILHANADGAGENNGIASIKLMGDAEHAAFIKGGHTSNGNTILTFHTDAHDSGKNPQERMRILDDGAVVINATARPVVGTEFLGVNGGGANNSVGIAATCSDNNGIPFFASNGSNTTSQRLMRFAAGSGGDTRGTITFNGSAMVYGGASDYRLKENITSISNGITKLKDLKPINFNWIKDETNTSIMGFLAHEVQEVMPQVVVGTKDEVNSEGKPEYQEIDLGGISPLIVAALQEAISKIETLETKVAALEAA